MFQAKVSRLGEIKLSGGAMFDDRAWRVQNSGG